MKYSLLHPSFGRPDLAFNAYKEWTSKGGNYEYVLSLDSTDSQLEAYKQRFAKEPVTIVVSDNDNCVQATNAGAEHCKGEVIIYVSDDFGCPDNWHLLLDKVRPKTDKYIIRVQDGIQPPTAPVLTIPIMSRELYKALGYFWHPEYESMEVDVDLFFTVKTHFEIVDSPLLFPHRHHSIGAMDVDDTARRHDNMQRLQRGQQIRRKREAQGYPV